MMATFSADPTAVAAKAIAAVELGENSVSVGGARYSWKTPEAAHGLLTQALYRHLHARIAPEAADSVPMMPPKRGDLTEPLRSVVPHRFSTHPAELAEGGGAPRGRLDVRLRTGIVVRVRSALVRESTTPGRVSVMLPAFLPSASPGYVVVTAPDARPVRAPVVRLYVNARPEGVAEVVGRLLHALGATRSRYVLKALNDTAQYPRADSVVLYAPADDAAHLTEPVGGLVRRLDPALIAPETSLLARPVARGCTVAWETPAMRQRHMSYGMAVADRLASVLLARGAGRPTEEYASALRDTMQPAV
jgi:hypothetical protein